MTWIRAGTFSRFAAPMPGSIVAVRLPRIAPGFLTPVGSRLVITVGAADGGIIPSAKEAAGNPFFRRPSTIATVAEERSAATRETGRNVTGPARGASVIASSIAGVALAARDTSARAHLLSASAGGLLGLDSKLRSLISQKYAVSSTTRTRG